MLKAAVLVSGRGSNLESILKAIDSGTLDAQISIVLSNKAAAGALEIAAKHNVPAITVESRGISRAEHEERVLAALSEYQFDYLVLAGYMRVLSPEFLNHFKDEATGLFTVINIHPSYLPAFPGPNAYDDAFNDGVAESGVTVHLVDEQVDHGPILAQQRFGRRPDDTLDSFKERGLAIEHKIFPEVLQRLSKEGLKSVAPGVVKQ
ncbi:MAG TPA: phosphoribosylglycinamide formyltransferase [Planktothrix sp.]